MRVAKWTDTYGIHHWRIILSSYRMLAQVAFEPTTTEFGSDDLTDWAIRPWDQLALRVNFVQLLQHYTYTTNDLQAITFQSLHYTYTTYIESNKFSISTLDLHNL